MAAVTQSINNGFAKDISKYIYRPGQDDSDSDSSTSSDSDTMNVFRHGQDDSDRDSDTENSLDEKIEDEKAASVTPSMKTKGELDINDLPAIEHLNITVSENDIKPLGVVSSILSPLVVVHANIQTLHLNEDSVIFLSNGSALGRVFEVFGQVIRPFYAVRFNSLDEINEKKLTIGTPVFYAPDHGDITLPIFVDDLKKQKGSDASWTDNNEPPVQHLDFSDDEEERAAKKQASNRNNNTNSVDTDTDTSDKEEDTPKPTRRIVSARRRSSTSHVSLQNNYFRNVPNRPSSPPPYPGQSSGRTDQGRYPFAYNNPGGFTQQRLTSVFDRQVCKQEVIDNIHRRTPDVSPRVYPFRAPSLSLNGPEMPRRPHISQLPSSYRSSSSYRPAHIADFFRPTYSFNSCAPNLHRPLSSPRPDRHEPGSYDYLPPPNNQRPSSSPSFMASLPGPLPSPSPHRLTPGSYDYLPPPNRNNQTPICSLSPSFMLSPPGPSPSPHRVAPGPYGYLPPPTTHMPICSQSPSYMASAPGSYENHNSFHGPMTPSSSGSSASSELSFNARPQHPINSMPTSHSDPFQRIFRPVHALNPVQSGASIPVLPPNYQQVPPPGFAESYPSNRPPSATNNFVPSALPRSSWDSSPSAYPDCQPSSFQMRASLPTGLPPPSPNGMIYDSRSMFSSPPPMNGRFSYY